MSQAKNHLTASTQAKNGSLYAVIQYKDENGKRKNKWKSLGLKEGASKAKINAAMREAVNDFEKELTDILTRSQNPDADMPVFEYMVKWLGSVQPSLQINTYRSYHNMIYGRIKRYFGPKSITIASLRPNQIDEFYQSIFDEGMVANTVIHYHAVMRRAFQQAYKKEILSANPFDRVERPKKNKFFGQNLSEEELLTLLSLARSETIYPAIILAGCMGLRRSEALGMRWSRIDMEKREVLLDTKVVEVEIDGEKILKPIEEMKNSSSRRSLPIPAPVYEMLVEQKAQQDLYRRMFKGSYNRAYDDYVCTDKLGNLLTPRYVTLRFSQVLEKNGMRHIRFHDLRHTFASILINKDMRTLPLVPFMRERLLTLKEEQQENRRLCGRSYIKEYLEYVCVNEIGDLIKPHYVTESFPKLLKAKGMRQIRYHDLRHSCASLLLANGVPMKQIQEWLGHSDFSTTANIYAHLDYSSKLTSADAMLNGLGFAQN